MGAVECTMVGAGPEAPRGSVGEGPTGIEPGASADTRQNPEGRTSLHEVTATEAGSGLDFLYMEVRHRDRTLRPQSKPAVKSW
jgi:hypothetical protein